MCIFAGKLWNMCVLKEHEIKSRGDIQVLLASHLWNIEQLFFIPNKLQHD